MKKPVIAVVFHAGVLFTGRMLMQGILLTGNGRQPDSTIKTSTLSVNHVTHTTKGLNTNTDKRLKRNMARGRRNI
jgi:hypothetical protein